MSLTLCPKRLIEVPRRAGFLYKSIGEGKSSDFVLWSDDVFRFRVLSLSDIDQQASRSDKHIPHLCGTVFSTVFKKILKIYLFEKILYLYF